MEDKRTGIERRQGERRKQWQTDRALLQLAVLDDLSAMLAGWLARNPSAPERLREVQEIIAKHQEG